MAFVQTMTVQTDSPEKVADLVDSWHREQSGTAPGYESARLLKDKQVSGRHVIEVVFASEADARRNNDRSETHDWASNLADLVDSDPEYHDYEVTFSTG